MDGISEYVLGFAKQIIAAISPICFVIGSVPIIKGLIRFAQANSRAHGGKGGMTYIVTGAFVMNTQLIISVLVNTITKVTGSTALSNIFS